MIDAIFIAGTDTDVGKTVASKAILQALAAQGFSTIGYKPVAAGCELTEEGMRNGDALHLLQAATVKMAYEKINPYPLTLPASPHIAAQHDQVVIEKNRLTDTLFQLKQEADIVLVEGAGGWRVPISEQDSLSSWVQEQQLAVILVVGIKLGCLSHALLTAESIRADGLQIVGWVANRVNPGTEHYADIIHLLETRLDAPKLGEIPYMPSIKSRDLGKYIDLSKVKGLTQAAAAAL